MYSDVHTTVRVSPDGLVRGAISELNCPFPNPQGPPSSPAPPSPTELRNLATALHRRELAAMGSSESLISLEKTMKKL